MVHRLDGDGDARADIDAGVQAHGAVDIIDVGENRRLAPVELPLDLQAEGNLHLDHGHDLDLDVRAVVQLDRDGHLGGQLGAQASAVKVLQAQAHQKG